MTGYYDIVLGLIPVALLGITASLSLVGLSLTAAVPIGAFVAMGIIGHAMFVNTPRTARTKPSRPVPAQRGLRQLSVYLPVTSLVILACVAV